MTGGKAATDIRVHEYRQILIWPFRLEGKETDPKNLRDAVAAMLKEPEWREVENLSHHLTAGADTLDGRQEGYQEFMYFHPFVRDFLFSGDKYRDDGKRQIRLFGRAGLRRAQFDFDNELTGAFSAWFNIKRLNLYLFDAGVAILVAEFCNGGWVTGADGRVRRMNLAHAETVLERLRRAYPPYWSIDEQGGEHAGFFPSFVRWTGSYQVDVRFGAPTRKDVFDQAEADLTPPPAGHWKYLLAPLDKAEIRLVQVMDERIPLMLYLRVDDPSRISEFDWVRLGMCDEPGKEIHAPPYGVEFLGNFRRDYCYDRHWITNDAGVVDPERASRYLFSGYGFLAVGGEDNWYFKNILIKHFRRHYFQMALLAQFEHATLLAESHRLAKAQDAESPAALQRILEFTQKYWFVDVSNQVQAREMFALWRKHLNTETLYKQVLEAAHNVTQFNEAKETRNSTEATTRLTVATLLVAVPSLAISFLSMDIALKNKVDESAILSLVISFFGMGITYKNKVDESALQTAKIIDNDVWLLIFWAVLFFTCVVGVVATLSWYYHRFMPMKWRKYWLMLIALAACAFASFLLYPK
jgi:hypothetical protein